MGSFWKRMLAVSVDTEAVVWKMRFDKGTFQRHTCLILMLVYSAAASRISYQEARLSQLGNRNMFPMVLGSPVPQGDLLNP